MAPEDYKIETSSNPELAALKKYLRSEGFRYDRSINIYYAPTDFLESNDMESFGLPENARHWNHWNSVYESFYVAIHTSERSFESCVSRGSWDWDLGNNVFFSWPQREDKKTRYEASLEALEKFKQEWTSFKETLPERLEKAKQELKAKTEELKNTNPVEEAIKKVKADGYIKTKNGFGEDVYRKVLANGSHNKLIAEIQVFNLLEAGRDWKASAGGKIYIAAGLSSVTQKASMNPGRFEIDWGRSEVKNLKKEFDFNVLNILSREASKTLYKDYSVDSIIKAINDFAQAYNNSKEIVSIE